MKCNNEKIRKEIEREYEELLDEEEGALGGWALHLWDYCTAAYNLSSYEEYKEAFLCTLKRLLDEGRVKLIRPGVDVISRNAEKSINDPETHWDAPSDEIIAWIQERWPNDIKGVQDIELVNFFFSVVPPLAWIGKDGMWY